MPEDTDVEALKADDNWRVIQGLQLFVLISFLAYMLFIVRYDSPKFYATNKQDEKAKQVISDIYET